MTTTKKKVLYLHTQPEHYVNLMIDDLNAASKDFFYQAAFLSRGHGWYKDLPVPKSCEPIFLRIRPGMEKYAQAGFRRAHVDWRQDIPPEQYDAVIVAGYAGVTQRQIMREFHQLGKPVMMMSDSNIRGQRDRSCRGKLKRGLKKRFLRKYIGYCSYLLTMNSRGRCYWRYYGAPKAKVIQCPMYADYSRVEEGRLSPRAQVINDLKIPVDCKIIVYPARLIPLKRHDMVIEAFKRAGLGQTGWRLVLAGSGPLEGELKALAGTELGKTIDILGFVQPRLLMPLIVHSHLMILASNYEAHGIVLGESACAGTPMLVSDVVGAARDLVLSDQSGWIFRSEDIDDLIAHFRRISQNEGQVVAMRDSTRRVFDKWFEKYNPIKIIESLVQVELGPHTRV